MDNPACSTVDVPSLHKTDDTNTSLFDDSEIELQCHYNEAVIVDDEENNIVKEETTHGIEVARLAEDVYSEVVLNIMQSSPSWKNRDTANNILNTESEDNEIEDKSDTFKSKTEDNCRISDGESCSSNSSSCLAFSDHYVKRKRDEDMEVEETNFNCIVKSLKDEIKLDNSSTKKIKLEENLTSEKLKIQRSIIPSKENPPAGMSSWLQQYQGWSHAERIVALNQLIDVCEPTQVRHMMQTIEPQFQRDFISLLPKELALYVLSFLEPRDLLRAAQTCRYWRCLTDDNLLWREKCIKAGVDIESVSMISKRHKNRVPNSTTSPWKLAYLRKHSIEMNWRVNPVRASKILKGHDDHVITCLEFCGNRIVSASDDNTLKVWSVTTGKCLRTLVGHTGGVWSSQMSGSIIISGSTDRTLKVWNAETGHCIHTLYGHTSTVRCMHLHGNIVVSGSRDATLRVWDIESGDCLHMLVGHTAAVRCVQYDGKLVVSGAYDHLVKVWDPETECCLHTLVGHDSRVYSLQFDGVHAVSGSLDASIRVWDVKTGTSKHTLMGHRSLTSGMELRNNILVSGNADSTVKVWDIISGRCLQTLSGSNKHQSAVTCLQFNSSFVITSSDDGTVKLWDVKTGEFIRDLVSLESGGIGGVVWRIRASETKLVCAVGSRNGTEETKLLVLDFDVETKER